MQKFIEKYFPEKEVSEENAKEKAIRFGHIFTLHSWWSRKSLAVSRAVNYLSLIPIPKNINDLNKKLKFITNFCKWENSLNEELINQARKDVLETYNGEPPKVLDPFGGGGSIPLEALRLGCETYSNDYNPVAVLIQKCILEYPQKYGKLRERKKVVKILGMDHEEIEKINPLLEDVKYWGNWLLEEAKKEIGKFFPNEPDGSVPIGYYWIRLIKCSNESCGIEIPLITNYWLSYKKNKKIALYPYIEDNEIKFKLVGTGFEKIPKNFNPNKGTISDVIVTCPVCNQVILDKEVKRKFFNKEVKDKLLVVISYDYKKDKKFFRLANEEDYYHFLEAELYLKRKVKELEKVWEIDPLPTENTPMDREKNKIIKKSFLIGNYGFLEWKDVFNSRQILSLLIFTEKIRNIYEILINKQFDEEYAKVIVTYLALAVSRNASYNSNLSWWDSSSERSFNVFGRQALPMVFDYSEQNPFCKNNTGVLFLQLKITAEIISFLSKTNSNPATVTNISATSLPYPDNFFDAIFTDPPYYDYIMYSFLSDFFYVWLKRSIGYLYPNLFTTYLTPQADEIIANTSLDRNKFLIKNSFERKLKKSFQEIYRTLKPNGIVTISYAHKSIEGWLVFINALLKSNLFVSSSCIVNTEAKYRLLSNNKATLSSSVYVICRKIKKYPKVSFDKIEKEIENLLSEKLNFDTFFIGTDFFIFVMSIILEIIGKYEEITDCAGNYIDNEKLIEKCRKFILNFIINKTLVNNLDNITKSYLFYRICYKNSEIPINLAEKFFNSFNVSLETLEKKFLIEKDENLVNLLIPQDRKIVNSLEQINILHNLLILFNEKKEQDVINNFIKLDKKTRKIIIQLAQIISEILDAKSKEKILIEKFLNKQNKFINMDEEGFLYDNNNERTNN